jgi:hypothetical protein
VDSARIADSAIVAAVLDECHKPLLGRMDRFAAEVHSGDGAVRRVFARLPEAMRCVSVDGMFLLLGQRSYRIASASDSQATKGSAVPPAEQERLLALRALLDAASFGPLHRATTCRRTAPGQFELQQPSGAPWTMTLRPGTLLPERFEQGSFAIHLRDYLRTKTTWIVRKAEVAGLGVCDITFEVADLAWDPDFFTPPADAPPNEAGTNPPGSGPTRIPFVAQTGAEPRSRTPILVDARAVDWVILRDPGTWSARVQAYQPIHAELDRQNQSVPGFPIFLRERDQDLMAVPYRARDPKQRLRAPANWQLRPIPASRLLVVYPPEGDFAARCAAGEKLLREAASAQSLRPLGAVVCQPFFHLEDGEPPAAKLQAPVVRVSLPVE